MLIPSKPEIITMTSLELVDYINEQRLPGEPELRHSDFVAKMPKVLGQGVCENFRIPYIHPQNKQTYYIYAFPKRESCLLAMSYSYELQAKVFDKMTALEDAAKPSFQLPDFSNPAAAARAWADAVDRSQALALENSQKQKQIEAAAPAVAFVEQYVEATVGSKGFRETAIQLGANERRLSEFLIGNQIMYYLRGHLTPFRKHLDAGRFECKVRLVGAIERSEFRFTPRGFEWVSRAWRDGGFKGQRGLL